MPRLAIALCALALLFAACGGDSDDEAPTATAPAAIDTPAATAAPGDTPSAVVPPETAPALDIDLLGGFSAYPIATGFFRATSVAVAPDGTIYVSERHGNVFRLRDNDGDGVFETHDQYASGFEEITGLLVGPDGTLYISSRGRVTTTRDDDGDGQPDGTTGIIEDLPNGRHQNNGLVIGPDGMLYLTNGSTCDDCDEADERSATILQANLDGSGLRVYATGLRNPYDLVFDAAGRLWATDNGSDEPCATVDELNAIVDGGDYGWPYGEDGCDPFNDGLAPAVSLGLHTASTGIDYYGATHFPEEYQGSLILSIWGSFFAEPEFPPQVLFAVPDAAGGAAIDTFAAGFEHPIDVLVDRDGTLLVLDYGTGGEDDTDGTLYRIVYTGG